MANVNVPKGAYLTVIHPGCENFLNAPLSPTLATGYSAATPGVVSFWNTATPGEKSMQADGNIGDSTTVTISGTGQFGPVTYQFTASIVAPPPPPPDPAALDHFNPTFEVVPNP